MGRYNKINIGILGGFQNGKSTFVNCLLDDLVARTGGYGLSVTSINTMYQFGNVQNVSYLSNGSILNNSRLIDYLTKTTFPIGTKKIVISLWKPILDIMNIIDTPGFNANEEDTNMAISSLTDIDIAILIIENKSIGKTELNVLSLLKQSHIPFFIIMNCRNHLGDSWMPKSSINNSIAKNNLEKIHGLGLKPISIQNDEIWQTNLQWFWFASEQYLNDNLDKQKKYTEDIEFYYNKKSLIQKTSIKEFCLYRSNFIPLRDFFMEDSIWNNFPLTFARWRKAIDNILNNSK